LIEAMAFIFIYTAEKLSLLIKIIVLSLAVHYSCTLTFWIDYSYFRIIAITKMLLFWIYYSCFWLTDRDTSLTALREVLLYYEFCIAYSVNGKNNLNSTKLQVNSIVKFWLKQWLFIFIYTAKILSPLIKIIVLSVALH
jgi:hypothetical protein